jgi:hypothetical protein
MTRLSRYRIGRLQRARVIDRIMPVANLVALATNIVTQSQRSQTHSADVSIVTFRKRLMKRP